MPSLLDILPPEAQHLLGIIAIFSIIAGLLLWSAGVMIARFSVAIFLGLLFSVAGAWQLPHDLPISPVTAALLGFVLGALIGAIAFRVLQGLVLASCVALAVAGLYYHHQSTASRSTTEIAAVGPSSTQDAGWAGESPQNSAGTVAGLFINTNNFSSPAPAANTAPPSAFATLQHKLSVHWNALDPADQKRLLVIAISFACATFLLALTFQKQTTWIASASLGTLLIIAGLRAAAHVYTPQYLQYFPNTPLAFYITLASLVSLGLLLQYKFCWPPTDRPNPLPHLQNPLYRGPQNMHPTL